MNFTVYLVVGLVVAVIIGIAIVIVGFIQGARGQKEKSEKTMKWFGVMIFIVGALGVFLYINDVGSEEANNGVQDSIANIIDTVKTGELSVNDVRPEEGQLYAHYIDVGDGEATLLDYMKDGKRKTVLIDMGEYRGDTVVKYLKQLRVRGIDILVGTSQDLDHTGEFMGIIENFRVNEIWLSGADSKSAIYGMIESEIAKKEINNYVPKVGEVYEDGKLKIEILNPVEGYSGNDSGGDVGLKVTFGEVGFIFTGDAGATTEANMVNGGVDLKSTVLHIGNHGSNTSTSQVFVDAVNPEVAIYSTKVGSEYKSESVVNRLTDSGAMVFGTDIDGTVMVSTDGKEYNVSKTGKQEPKKEQEEDIKIVDVEDIEEQGKSTKLVPIVVKGDIKAEVEQDIERVSKALKNREEQVNNTCIDINSARVKELQEIKHVTKKIAARIVDGRPYNTASDLEGVKGLSAKKVERIKEEGSACALVTVKGDK